MKFVVSKEQHHYYQKNGCLELEGLLSPKSLLQIREGVQSSLSHKLQMPNGKIASSSPLDLIKAGRDLWRHSEQIKKYISSLGEIAAQLTVTKTVRLGYDQLLLPLPHSKILSTPTLRPASFEGSISLSEMSCLQGIICGAMLCLQAADEDVEASAESIFPLNAGNITFFSAEKEINFIELHRRQKAQFLLVAYTENIALYIMQENDPCVHDLKSYGYVFGDRLNDRLHPIVYR